MSFQHPDIPPGGTPAVAHSRRAIPGASRVQGTAPPWLRKRCLRTRRKPCFGKAIELAKAGNVPMMSLLGSHLQTASVLIDLPPLERAGDAVDASAAIIDAVSTGRITPSEGSELTSVVEAHARAINDADVELRMDNLEKKVQQIISELEDKLKAR